MEKFITIPGYEGYYECGSNGTIRSIERKVPHGRFGFVNATGKILKQAIQVDGYLKVALSKEKKLKTFTVHRLICLSFYGAKNGLEINHRNGNKKDNRVENLEYVTRSENVKHSFDIGLAKPKRGSENGNSKITKEDVFNIRKMWATGNYMQKQIAEVYNLSTAHVKDIVNKRSWKWL